MMLADAADKIRRAITDRLKLQGSYKAVFDKLPPDENATRILNHLIRTCHVTTPTFVPGDPYLSAVNEGKRQVVIAMLNQIHMDPEKLTKQIEQAYENSENGR